MRACPSACVVSSPALFSVNLISPSYRNVPYRNFSIATVKMNVLLYLLLSCAGHCVVLDIQGADPGVFDSQEQLVGGVKVTEFSARAGGGLATDASAVVGEDAITKVVSGDAHVWKTNGPICNKVWAFSTGSAVDFLRLELDSETQGKLYVHYELEEGVFVPIALEQFEKKVGAAGQIAVTVDISQSVEAAHNLNARREASLRTSKSVIDGVVLEEYYPKRGFRLAKIVDGDDVLFRSEVSGCAALTVASFNGEKKLASLYIPGEKVKDANFLHLEKGENGWQQVDFKAYQQRYQELKKTIPKVGSFELDLANPDLSVAHVNEVKDGKLDVRVSFPLPGCLVDRVKHGDSVLWAAKKGERYIGAMATAGGLKKAVVLSFKDASENQRELFFLEQEGELTGCTKEEFEAFMKEVAPNMTELPMV
ncbi:hypothetical protein BEWA_048610 [Theileria equi strain WA]|uniref:Signal peptide containing protein n=1 Tax=Theileria equi strain WA TaxID=1537102 RepID=L1LAV2_THEEQ|nr:hypothetical protein BEWA_048610 [Theileria equi strain WA]EKX72394.1 hypothetical protein BEWA_048610 [Theileria equi strain WA]|eukprot:XP_004831846.1 hypothetical protein BEWA_048610 [Theileria equi strain WA]